MDEICLKILQHGGDETVSKIRAENRRVKLASIVINALGRLNTAFI